jgi:hypothetical protein
MSEKSLKNYIYDNPDLLDSKLKKVASNISFKDDDDKEIWLLQCPKNVDPHEILNCELGKLAKKTKLECHTDRFDETKTLAVITPEVDDEVFSESLRLVSCSGASSLSF